MPGAERPTPPWRSRASTSPLPSRRLRAGRSASGSDHGQQKPATSRAVAPSAALPRIRRSSSLTEPTIRKSKSSSIGQRTCGRPIELERVVDPLDERVGAVRAELRLELELADLERALGGGLADEVRAADLARADDLEVVDEEDGHAAGVEDVVDLGLAGARLRGREAARADRPDPVGLVEDDDVERLVDVRGVAEVLEQRAGARRRRSCAGSR